MPSEAFDHITTALTRPGRHRVWSLIISVFGELVQSEGSSIEGPVLSALMARMNVKPEAVRVALHRLRNDGWIISQKSGRMSCHSLTRYGLGETLEATRLIYGAPADMPVDWHVAVTAGTDNGQRDRMIALGYALVAPCVFIGTGQGSIAEDALVTQADNAPNWLKALLMPAGLTEDYRNLHIILQQIDETLVQANVALSSLEVAVLRCLIVHDWRRLVLKHPALPRTLYTSDWKGHDCRALVHKILLHYPQPALEDLSE
ncbi:MAG: PaaX family transcriptional regulator C-terminal domain-containing protein [Paracoccaceae bacterium]|nr:PaaX family transcriptional regulator C-terminal domain-containing protein [Paracoccaceae bacterium]